ncbi:hypothetical protein [Streptomyces sp. OR43]|uniref:hypothetical protein n=1 Tax=Streptomyces sp. or43 TaxID=2478957 RepID=UPI0011CE3B07|nr:hypothetical protein [Streptomyces sp. or43]TXS38157.1 hypothetical protein EAO72_33660 [Streptomyces sp. or43]
MRSGHRRTPFDAPPTPLAAAGVLFVAALLVVLLMRGAAGPATVAEAAGSAEAGDGPAGGSEAVNGPATSEDPVGPRAASAAAETPSAGPGTGRR